MLSPIYMIAIINIINKYLVIANNNGQQITRMKNIISIGILYSSLNKKAGNAISIAFIASDPSGVP